MTDNESLARIGATCLLLLGMGNGPKFTEEQWTLVCTKFSTILTSNIPRELMNTEETTEGLGSSKSKSTQKTEESTQEVESSLEQTGESDAHSTAPATPRYMTVRQKN